MLQNPKTKSVPSISVYITAKMFLEFGIKSFNSNLFFPGILGATVGHRPSIMTEIDISTKCHLFEVRKIGDEYFSFFEQCEDPKACSIILRGGGKGKQLLAVFFFVLSDTS